MRMSTNSLLLRCRLIVVVRNNQNLEKALHRAQLELILIQNISSLFRCIFSRPREIAWTYRVPILRFEV